MKDLMTVEGLQVFKGGKLVAPFHTEVDAGTPINGEIIADEQTGYGKIYINGRWVLFGQDSVPLVQTQSSAYTQTGSAYVPVDTSASSFVITLDPLPTPGDRIIFFDVSKSWYTNPLQLSSSKKIDGSTNNLVINVKGGAIELLYVDDATGYVIIDGNAKENESSFLGVRTITANTVAVPRYEYYVTSASAGIDLTLPATGPEGAVIRLTDGAGRASAVSIRMRAATAIVNGNKTTYELGNNYGSVTVQGRTIAGTYRWIVIQENAYTEAVGFGAVGATTTISNREDLLIPVNTSGGSLTITMPSSPRPYQKITFYDHSATWHTHGFQLNFGAKSSSSHGASKWFRERRGFITATYNPTTDNWEVASNETHKDVIGWQTQTGNFTAVPFMGYRLATSSSFEIMLPDPTGLPADAVIRFVNESDDTQSLSNIITVKVSTPSHAQDAPYIIGTRGAVEFRLAFNGNTPFWYRASFSGHKGQTKRKTSSFKAYGNLNYLCDFGGNATITLDTTYTKVGETITLFDPDGGWAGRNIVVTSETGTIDGWGTRRFGKGYAVLTFKRLHGGWITTSENYLDYRDVSSTSEVGKLNTWLRGLHGFTRATGSFTAVEGFLYNVRATSVSGILVTLPTPTRVGSQICLVDEYGVSQKYPISIKSSNNLIGSGRNLMRLASNGGMILFESRYDNGGLKWYPVLTPDGDNKITYTVNNWNPGVNSKVPINGGGTVTLPDDPRQGDEVTIYEHEYRKFKNVNVNVVPASGHEIMNAVNRSFTIPDEVSSVTFVFSEHYNTWTIKDVAFRINTATSKIDLATNLTWTDTGSSVTAAANHGYRYELSTLGASRTVTLPTSGIELNSVVAVSLTGTSVNGRYIAFSGGTIDGKSATSYEWLRAPGEYVELVNRGNGVWTTKNRSITNSKIYYPNSNSISIDFDNGENTVERTITGNTSITASFPGGVVTTFFILLRQDGTGNRNITLPSSWKKSAGSEEFNLTRNAYNLIQGTHINGKVFYNVTAYI